MFYNNGIGTEKNPALAFQWFKRAAQGGDPLASYKVGCYYADQFPGVVPPDEEKALNAKLVAARAGYSLAQSDVVLHYAKQKNTRKNMAELLTWGTALAEQGDLQSYVELAYVYQRGETVKRDSAKAYEYLQIAVRHLPESRAKVLQPQLDNLRKELSDSAAETAEKAAAEWVAKPTELTIRAQLLMQEARKIAR
jgi:TPR repeat protein